jgi:hypothetical protein
MKLSPAMQQVLDNAKREYGREFIPADDMRIDGSRALWDANSKTVDSLIARGLAVAIMRGRYTVLCLTQQGYDLGNAEEAEVSHKNICPKCGGTGYIRQYSHVSGGICFHCNGTGKHR